MPSSQHIVIQKEAAQTQLQRLQQLLDRNRLGNVDLWAGYQYIRANISGDTNWDQRLLEWLRTAAEINGPDRVFMKQFVFGMNDEAAWMYQRRHISWSENQRASDSLARQLIGDYMNALRTGQVLAPQQIFEADVGTAVRNLHLPRYAWAGGPIGAQFGFDISYIYPDSDAAWRRGQEWVVNADTVTGRIQFDDPGAVGTEVLLRTLRALRKRVFGINLYTDERLDPLSPGADGFANIPGLVNATYSYFKTSIPQQYSVQVENDDGSPMGPTTYNVFYRVGPTFELQISTPRGTSTLTSNDWTSSGDEANFQLTGGGTTANVKTSAQGGAAAQKVVSASINGQDITNNVAIATNLAGILGNSLTRFVAGSDPLAQVAAGTVIQAVGLNLAQAIAQGGIARDITFQLENGATQTVRNNVLSNFGQEVATAFQNAAIGSFSALLTTELGRTLGLNGFGAELFNTAAGTGASAVIGKVIGNIQTAGAGLFDGISLSKVFATGVPDVLSGALGSFFGAKLGSLVISPTNTEGAVLSSVGSAAGAWAASAAGGKLLGGVFQVVSKLGVFGGPFVGAFVGFVLGALIGKLFGKKKPRIPTANAVLNLDLASGYFTLGAASAANGGNRDLVVNMAISARDILNGLISVVVGGVDIAPNANTSGNLPNQTYGHTGNQIWVKYRQQGQRNVADATEAVEYGVLRAIKDTRIMGGDLLVKRALILSPAVTSVALTGDLQVAADYRTYLENRRTINQIIQAAPTSAFAATWATVLARAADLNLNKFQASDFYGGLAGFASSFGFGERSAAYEALVLTSEGTAIRIATTNGTAPFELLAGSNNIADPIAAARSVLISNFGANVGYSQWTGQATAGNDIWIAAGGGPVTMDDMGEQEEWYWNPYDQAWEVRYTQVSGGDDIFIGSSYDDALYGRAGWDWLDGGAGQDVAYGGSEDDVLLGRAGVDSLYGEGGNDYLAGGDGGDHPAHPGSPYNGGLWGGDGNDTLVGGGGHDLLSGGNGDDLFIVEQDGGGTWDYHSGEAGSDTASFERFNAGINFDLTTGSGDGYTARTHGDGFLSIENVTGSQFNDIIRGDAGNNILSGLDGSDQLFGSDGDDVMIGGAGADMLNGGAGTDTASYQSSQQGVVVSLRDGMGLGGDAIGDTFFNIENLQGSDAGDDLTGSSGDNVLRGGRGDDVLHMTGGSDVIDGGDGFDTLDASTPLYTERLVSGGVLLQSGAVLNPGQTVTSADGRYMLAYQGDNNLVLYGPSGPVWASGSVGHAPGWAHVQPDGNLVIYNGSGTPIWSTNTYGNNGASLYLENSGRLSLRVASRQIWESRSSSGIPPLLYPGEVLYSGQYSISSDGQYQLHYQTDGNLVLYGTSGPIWASNTAGHSPNRAHLQEDGNLVIYNSFGMPVWSSNTWGAAGASFHVTSDGRLTVNDTAGGEVWASRSGPGLAVYYDEYAGAIASLDGATTSLSGIERFVGTGFADSISGSNADEVFEGGAWNDYLVGAGGSDTFVFGRGDGHDTVYSSSAGASTILLKEDVNWRDVSITGANYSQQYGNLTVSIRGTLDQMTVGSNFYYVNGGNNAGQHTHAIKSLSLSGMSTVDIDMIDWTPYAADDGSTVVYGAQNRSDLIFAYGGDDTIYTASGGYETRGNVVYAGDGNDTIFASAGDDQYIFERGNGIDTLYDNGGADTIVMGPSVAADDVIYEVVESSGSADLYIGIRNADNPNATASQVADRIRVVNGGMKYIGTYYGNERLNTIEYVRVGGQEIDLTKANINWAIGYEDDGGYYGGGGGGGGYNIPPLAIDLDGDGIELRSVEGSRIASIDADGTVTRMGWLGPDDGFLALDRDGNGVIDRIGEISFASDVKGARTDLEGLAAYDSNGDGRLDASDARWSEFKVWQDKNQDGFGSKNELVSLDKAGITFINLKGQQTGFTGAGTDGFDNTVIATTEIGWADKTRTGSGYDVLLARMQVRTDGGAKDFALADALARGVKVDDLEAFLHGVQSLTKEQVEALRATKTQGRNTLGEGGLLYRTEDLLGTTTKLVGGAAAKTVNGLLSIDPSIAQKIVAGSRALGLIDRYAGSDWTKLGSIVQGKADMRDVVASVEKRDLSAELKNVITDARKIVADRKLVEEAKTTALAAKDAADAVLRPPKAPPTPEETAKLKAKDTFKLLEPETDNDTEDTPDDNVRQQLQQVQSMLSSDGGGQTTAGEEDAPSTLSAAGGAAIEEARSSEATQRSVNTGSPEQGAMQQGTNSPEIEAYGVVIRAANARLVQALASFGDAPAMMASYQGLNVANDPQAAWLSVDAMPSIQRLATIR